jgi:hypothetical protein
MLRQEYWTSLDTDLSDLSDLFRYCQRDYIEDRRLPEYSYWVHEIVQEDRQPLGYVVIEVPMHVVTHRAARLFDMLQQAAWEISEIMRADS